MEDKTYVYSIADEVFCLNCSLTFDLNNYIKEQETGHDIHCPQCDATVIFVV